MSSPTGHVSISRFWNGRGVTPDPAPVAETIAANTVLVRERIARAARGAHRDPHSVRLVAVSKKFSAAHVRAAVAACLSDLGENRVQEALAKIAETSDLSVMWHLVGHLQSNKARSAAAAFGWIHSVDSLGLLERIENAAKEAGTRPNVLVQVDLAGESQKHGAAVDETRRIVQTAAGLTHVTLRGLMVLPPWSENPAHARPFFRQLRELRDQLVDEGIDSTMLAELSMGMSQDLEVAIAEGATFVRIGTALFGPRPRVTR